MPRFASLTSRVLAGLASTGRAANQLLYTFTNPTPASLSTDWGYSVAVSDQYLVVGSPSFDSAQGRAHVYDLSSGQLLYTLLNPNWNPASGTSDQFGATAAISGNRVAITALAEDSPGSNSGRVYVFDLSTGTELYNVANPSAGTALFGRSLSLSDSYLIVGNPDATVGGSASVGLAYVFAADTGSLLWSLESPNPLPRTNWRYGESVSVSGDVAVISEPRATVGVYTNDGQIHAYDLTTGSLLRTITNPNTVRTSSRGDQFGTSVYLEGDICAASAIVEDSAASASSNAGAVYLVNVSTGATITAITDPDVDGIPTNDNFGYKVSLVGDRLLASTINEDQGDSTLANKGAAYLIDTTTGDLLETFTSAGVYDDMNQGNFGYSISMSDRFIAISAWKETAVGRNLGRVYVYLR